MGVRVDEPRQQHAAGSLDINATVPWENFGGRTDVDDLTAGIDDDGGVTDRVPVARDDSFGVYGAHPSQPQDGVVSHA
jgi:hypothetical protein